MSIRGLDQHCLPWSRAVGHLQNNYQSYPENVLRNPRKSSVFLSFDRAQPSVSFSICLCQSAFSPCRQKRISFIIRSARIKVRYQADIMSILCIITIVLVFSQTHKNSLSCLLQFIIELKNPSLSWKESWISQNSSGYSQFCPLCSS